MNDLTCTRLDVHRVPDTKQKGLQKVDVALFLDDLQQLILFLGINWSLLNPSAMPRRALRCVVDLKLKAVSILIKSVLVLTNPL